MSSAKHGRPFGVLAQFDTPAAVYHACERIRDAGYTRWDSYTPFPVHGLERAMGLKPSKVPWIVMVCGFTGAGLGFLLQVWVHVWHYPLVIAAKPYFAWQAYIPITFELGVLFAAFGAVFGMLGLNRLPQHYHPLFRSKRFERVTDDRFFVAIEAGDPRFDEEGTAQFLKELGASHVETIRD